MNDVTTSKPLLSPELKLRIVSAVILAALVLLMTWAGGQTFKLLWAVAALAIMIEYSRITSAEMPIGPRLAAFGFLFLAIASWFLQSYTTALVITGLGFLMLGLWEWITSKSVWAAIGLLYAALPCFAMTALRGETFEGLLLIIVLFACVWGADVFAYFFGKGIGGPKLAPRISPKKTWAGFIGSLIGSALLSWAVVTYAGYSAGAAFFAVILVIAIASQVGDLFESVIKRRFGVKDSGQLIPGHGGVLDRIDGLIFSSVILWLWLQFISGDLNFGIQLASYFFNAFLLP